jgi:hypothetical protein
MFDFRDLFQWERFITPTIIKVFYWLAIALSVLWGLAGLFTGLSMLLSSPLGGLVTIIISILGVLVGVIFARIAAEFILIVFRINEHLGAIRSRGEAGG